jgi:hypothetical protein
MLIITQTDRISYSQREAQDSTTMGQEQRRDYDQLDLNEDIGPEMEDPLFPLGSFAEESPPRAAGRRTPTSDPMDGSDRKRPASSSHPRRSPPPHPYFHYSSSHNYRRSPRSGAPPAAPGGGGYHATTPSTSSQHGRPPPPPMYHYGSYHGSPPPGYTPRTSPRRGGGYYPQQQGYSPYYHYHPEQQHWEGGQQHYPPPYDHEEDAIPPPPPSSTKKRPNPDQLPMSPRTADTPEKGAPKPRSPFRSPPTSKQRFRRSPAFASPYIGSYGSFGMMDTPSGAILAPAEFSPMGPSFTEFGDEENSPLPLATADGFPQKLSISRSGSQDSRDTPVIQRRSRPKDEPSPLSGFMSELSPFAAGLQGVPRSPLHHS